MVKSRKKSTKKNKRSRKIRGGTLSPEERRSIENFNKNTGQKDKYKTKCVDPLGIHKEDFAIPIWIYRLKLIYEHFTQTEGLEKNKWSKNTKKYRDIERKKWCGNKNKPGYCQTGKAFVHMASIRNSEKRCLKGSKQMISMMGKKRHLCLVDLNLKEWWHCNKHCGQDKNYKDEDKVSCDDVKVKIGKQKFDMNVAEQARNKHNIKLEIEELEKKKKAEITKQNELNRQKKLLAKKKEQERLAKEKAEKERIRAAEVLARKKKLEEDKKRQEKDKRNQQCLKDITRNMNIEANKIKKINWNNVKTEADIERVNRQLATINQLGQKLEPLFKDCFEEFGSLKDEYMVKLKKVQEDIIPLFNRASDEMERIVNTKKMEEMKAINAKTPSVDVDGCEKFINERGEKIWKPHKSCRVRCPEPETCKDPLCVIPSKCKKKIKKLEGKNPPEMKIVRADTSLQSCPGKICRGSIITGRPYDAWTTREYEGYALDKKKKNGIPVIYNYDNKYPWFGYFVKERQASTTNQKTYKGWFNKYLQLHKSPDKNDGRQKALKSMKEKHNINIPQQYVKYFPMEFKEKASWKRGGKSKKGGHHEALLLAGLLLTSSKKKKKKTRNRKKKKRSTKKKR
jgi:hypothetical protein